MAVSSQLRLLLALATLASAGAFAPNINTIKTSLTTTDNEPSSVVLFETKKPKKGGLDEGVRNKLLSESIAPWRTLRLFLYGSLGSGAFVGGLINISGAVAASASPDFNLNKELMNVGIDFAAVAVFGFLAKYDIDKQNELQTKVEEKVQRKKEEKKIIKQMNERTSILKTLPLEITVSTEGDTRQATVNEMQMGAKQHMILVIGPRKACKDALVGANLLKMDFALSNVLVVPYDTSAGTNDIRPSGGFGERPSYETQPFIARPTGEGWNEYVKAEMDDAVKQSGENAREEGIAIVVASNGKVIRRGVGTVPWRQMVEQLEEEVNPNPDKPLTWL
ncbi:unnamed protein product [Cylindrotheca closterium]|uniref:Photosystem I assembly protein Ycf4 n=1 Tax=Cylindrotheca closterium TaxID=2856 RepID=A0AAD2GCK9_9STRA|nr:unnamed protein product [Cylindrotheca closterium]